MFLTLLAHERLLDFKSALIPPRDDHQEGERAGSPCQSGGLGIEEKPLARVAGHLRRPRSEQAQRSSVQFPFGPLAADRFRKPSPHPEILAKLVAPRRCAENFRQPRRAWR